MEGDDGEFADRLCFDPSEPPSGEYVYGCAMGDSCLEREEGGAMRYEEFEARAKSAFDGCSEMRRMLWNMQTVAAAVPDMVRKNERLDRERAELRQENAELKVKLDDWKGNAEGSQPDAYMKLLLDADGEPIHIGDVLYSSGNECRVVSVTVKADEAYVGVYTDEGVFLPSVEPRLLSRKSTEHRAPEPPDSWEKLSEDAMKGSCIYFGKTKDASTVCSRCPHGKKTGISCWQSMNLDLVKRAKRLAGIEEQEGDA